MNISKLSFGVFFISFYGLFVSLAFGIAAWHFYRTAHKKDRNFSEFFAHHFWKWFLCGIVMGRLFGVLLHPEVISEIGWLSFFFFWKGEIYFLGGIIGALGLAFYDMKRHGKSFWLWLDRAIPSILIGIMLVDIAAFFTGAVYGTETNLFWGVRYETFGVPTITPVHPITLYALAIHLLLYRWVKKKQKTLENKPGKIALFSGLILVGSEFFLQFYHGNFDILIFGILRLQQLILLMIFVGIFSLYRKKTKPNS